MTTLAVELVTMPVKCMSCGIVYKNIPACPAFLDHPDMYSSGYCPDCLPAVEEAWFGKKLGAEEVSGKGS